MDAASYKLSKERIKTLKMENYTKSHLVVLLNLLMLVASVIFFMSPHILLYCMGVILLALQMMHSYLIVHETAHGTFYKKASANNICGNFFAFFAFMPFYSRRYEHATHHREAGSFHEPSTRRAMDRFSLIDPKMAAFMTVCWKLWVPIFAINEHIMLWTLPFEEGMDARTRKAGIIAACLYSSIILCMLTIVPRGGHVLLAFLPALYFYMVLVEFFNLPHHLSSPVEDIHGAVPYYEQAKYTRSCAPLPAPFGSWFALNFNYHVAHHLYPAVHWSKVPQAHKIMIEIDAGLTEELAHEWHINHQMRKQPLRAALSKYFDQQAKEHAELKAQ